MTEDQKPCKNCQFNLSLWGVAVCILHEGQPGSQFYQCSDYDSQIDHKNTQSIDTVKVSDD